MEEAPIRAATALETTAVGAAVTLTVAAVRRTIAQVRVNSCLLLLLPQTFNQSWSAGYDRAGPSASAYDSRGSGGPVRSYESRGPESRERARPY